MAAPSDAESVAMYRDPDQAAAEINKFLVNHPLSVALRADPAWSESRPHLRYPEAHKKRSLTAGTLMGPTTIPVPPLVFTDQKHLVWMCYLSTDLCGHVGIVHGGMLATILDEGLGRCSFASLPNKIGVTASLTVNYRKPAPAGCFVVLKAETTKAEGRKVWVKGRIEILNQDETPGTVLADAEALFIEPKYASVCSSFAPAATMLTPPDFAPAISALNSENVL
jgi:3'-phosphoadenosine 5'-phosphosulfate synthase